MTKRDSAIDNDELNDASVKRSRTASFGLEPVHQLIKHSILSSSTPSTELALALLLAFRDVCRNKEWKKVLHPRFMDLEKCEKAVEESKELEETLRNCLENHDWQPLFDKPLLRITETPPMASQCSSHTRREQAKATEMSWNHPFKGRGVLALWEYIREHHKPSDKRLYAHYCAIVQSSGTGKSRTVDELAKNHFVIPLNLREAHTTGYPPADHNVREFLIDSDSRHSARNRTSAFLEALFTHTTNQLRAFGSIDNYASYFRVKMTDGQNMEGHNTFRTEFYDRVISAAKKLGQTKPQEFHTLCDQAEMDPSSPSNQSAPLYLALKNLVEFLASKGVNFDRKQTYKGKPDPIVIFVIDEAHTITTRQEGFGKWSVFNELRHALRSLNLLPFFSLFLSTTDRISQLAAANRRDLSRRVSEGALAVIQPYSDFTFAPLVAQKIDVDAKQDLSDLAQDRQICSLGRPLFSCRYLYGSEPVQAEIFQFAISKLLNADDIPERLDSDQALACLSQRVPIQFYSTNYIATESEKNQVEGHMRWCLKLDAAVEAIATVSASEPLLSEAAYSVMSRPSFKAPEAMLSVMEGFSVSKGDRGEFVALLHLILARDAAVGPPDGYGRPLITQRLFGLTDFLCGHVFKDQILPSKQVDSPSIAALKELRGEFRNAQLHFNHFTKVDNLEAIRIQTLLLLMGRGAAVVCANSQKAIDAINIFLKDGTTLSKDNAGLILYQFKNDPTFRKPDGRLFRAMDSYTLGILEETDRAVPLVKVVFALAASKPHLHVERCAATEGYNATVYEIWCRGISPDIFGQITAQDKGIWDALLQASQDWKTLYKGTPEAVNLRRGARAGAGAEAGYFDDWAILHT